MDGNGNWSLSLGRWGRLSVRIHMFFLLFAAFTCYLGWNADFGEPAGHSFRVTALSLGILVLSVLLHEMGHVVAARRFGCRIDEIVLGPLGGMGPVGISRDSNNEMIVHLAGPFVNLLICLFCTAVLFRHPNVLIGLLHPLEPAGLLLTAPLWLVVTKLAFWVNWVLILVNLIPAFPFDGGRALRAGLSRLWPQHGRLLAGIVVARLAQLGSAGLLVVAWFMRDSEVAGPVPIWFALVLMSIFLFFSARQHQDPQIEELEEEEDLFGYDFSQGYTSLERIDAAEEDSPLAQWFEQRRQAKSKRDQEIALDDEKRVDEILARLHMGGIASLSREDRALLERVSARYRNRHEHRA